MNPNGSEVNTGETAEKAQLWEKEKKLIDGIVDQGESVLYTWSHVDNAKGVIGFGPVNPEGKVNYHENVASYFSDSTDSTTSTLSVLSGNNTDISKLQQSLQEDGVYEVVVVKPIIKPVIAKRAVTKLIEEKGFLGRKRQVEKVVEEEYEAGQEPVTMRDAAKTDSSEPAVWIRYMTQDWNDPSLPMQDRYDNIQRRPGNSIDCGIIVPSSLAEQFSQLLLNDPALARKVMSAIIERKYSKRFVAETWNNRGKPPYEAWERNRQPSLYFVDFLRNSGENDVKANTYDKNKVIKFKTTHVNGIPFGVIQK